MTTQTEALRLALEALLTTGSGTDAYGVTRQWHDEEAVDNAIAAIKEALAAPQTTGNILMDSYNQMVAMKEAAPQRDQSDWDEVPKSFNDWWDKDYDGNGNPFSFDSPAYWAWAGWKAAAPQGDCNCADQLDCDGQCCIKAAPHDDREPNNDEVICPNCTTQFRAIPVNVQKLMLDAGFEPPFTAAPLGEPVGYAYGEIQGGTYRISRATLNTGVDLPSGTPLYAHPAPAPLTYSDGVNACLAILSKLHEAAKDSHNYYGHAALEIERHVRGDHAD